MSNKRNAERARYNAKLEQQVKEKYEQMCADIRQQEKINASIVQRKIVRKYLR